MKKINFADYYVKNEFQIYGEENFYIPNAFLF